MHWVVRDSSNRRDAAELKMPAAPGNYSVRAGGALCAAANRGAGEPLDGDAGRRRR